MSSTNNSRYLPIDAKNKRSIVTNKVPLRYVRGRRTASHTELETPSTKYFQKYSTAVKHRAMKAGSSNFTEMAQKENNHREQQGIYGVEV